MHSFYNAKVVSELMHARCIRAQHAQLPVGLTAKPRRPTSLTRFALQCRMQPGIPAQRVASAVLQAFAALSKTGKPQSHEHTVLSGDILQHIRACFCPQALAGS